MINLFCSKHMTQEDALGFLKGNDGGCPIIVCRNPWIARIYSGQKILHLYMEYHFAPDMAGDVYTCEAILHSLLVRRNRPEKITVAVHREELIRQEQTDLKELLAQFDNM